MDKQQRCETSGIIRSRRSRSSPSFSSLSRYGIKVRCWKGDRDNADADEGAGSGEREADQEGGRLSFRRIVALKYVTDSANKTVFSPSQSHTPMPSRIPGPLSYVSQIPAAI